MRKSSKSSRSERGSVIIMVTFFIAILMAVGAMVFDLGFAWIQKRQMQTAADGGSLSGVWWLQQVPDAALAVQVNTLTQANEAVVGSEVMSIQCGTYNVSTRQFTACAAGNPNCSNCQSAQANSVRVLTSRRVPSIFGKLLGITALNTPAESIAVAQFPNDTNCLRPFGIEAAGQPGSALNGITPGQTFTVGAGNSRLASGNWGKLDIGFNMSSGQNFRDYMFSAVCNIAATNGQQVSQGTGNAGAGPGGVGGVFDDLLAAGLHKNLYMPKVSDYGNGNNDVRILGFMLADYISQGTDCGRGSNWCATFRMVADNVTPPVGGGTGIPNRAHLAR